MRGGAAAPLASAMECHAKPRVEAARSESGPVERGSRPVAGRTATATSEPMDVTAGETAPATPSKAQPDLMPWAAGHGLAVPPFLFRYLA